MGGIQRAKTPCHESWYSDLFVFLCQMFSSGLEKVAYTVSVVNGGGRMEAGQRQGRVGELAAYHRLMQAATAPHCSSEVPPAALLKQGRRRGAEVGAH